MTYHAHQHTFEKLVKAAGGFVQRQVSGKYHITVDPVNGSDAPDNDGTVTPLKTLEALFQRLPKAQQTTSGGATFATDESVAVLLKAGEHRLEFDLINQYAQITADISNVSFYGELSAGTSFVLDSWSGGYVKMHQPAGNPAWIVDEHVGKVIDAPIDWGPPYGIYNYYWFILANGTHDLTVAFSYSGDPLGWSTYIPIGTTLTIRELATRWVGPRTTRITGESTWNNIAFTLIKFDSTHVNTYRALFEQWSGSLVFYQCAMVTDTFSYGNSTAFAQLYSANAFQYQSGCFYRNHFAAVSVTNGAFLDMSDVCAVNCQRLWESGGIFYCQGGRTLYLRNCGDTFFSNGGKGMIDWDIYNVYCIDTWNILFCNIGDMSIFARGWYSSTPDPTMIPSSWFGINDGNRLMVRGWSIEGKPPYNHQTIIMGGYGVEPAQAFLSVGDLRNLYGNYYDFGYGCTAQYN
jgi:hypothetical protein